MSYPLYITVQQAAEMSGIGEKTIRDWLNSSNPMPYIKIGAKKLIQRDALPEYLKSLQEVRL
jgi:excisionase family DNA binding protein